MVLNNSTNCVYEEQKTFVPTVSGTVTAGVGTYTNQTGYWSRIGNLVFITLNIIWTAHTGSGDILISNLPFPCNAATGFDPEFIVNIENITLPATTVSIYGHMQQSPTTIIIQTIRSNGTNVPVGLTATGILHATGWYLK